jgi:hypothetical protein
LARHIRQTPLSFNNGANQIGDRDYLHRFIGKESAKLLTLVSAAGAAARNSIGLVLVGGITIGTIFTLFIVPSLLRAHREGASLTTIR